MYKILFKASVEKDLKKIDKSEVKKILDALETKLAKDPLKLGKKLKGKFKDYFSYRAGDYRVIYKVSEQEILIIVLRIAHRKDVYE